MYISTRIWISRVILFAQIVVLLLIARNWAYVTTYRLYLDHRIASERSTAAQQFDIEGARVVPLIVTRGADRVAFATGVGQDSTVRVDLRAAAPTTYAIEWRRESSRAVLAQGVVDGPLSIVCAYPTGTGVLDLVSGGPLTWADARVVRNLRLWPHVTAFAALTMCWLLLWARRWPENRAAAFGNLPRLAAFKMASAALSVVSALLIAETALHALGDWVPSGIVAERHDLGEVTRDPRWIESARYGRRLRSNVDAQNEWRYGDIVRMGYIPAPATADALHRFTFHTDAEGFRNREVRERFEVAALGDSFTDAMTMAAEASWPARLERILGAPVQNYGTAGFGPQQELLVLKDFVRPHRPRVVVLAFFAGNDIFDAEAFDAFQRSGGTHQRTAQGWRIKDVISRADTWFVVSALRAGGRWMRRPQGVVEASTTVERPVGTAMAGGRPSFDRGMFDVPAAGRRLPFALMPPYLNTLNFSERELQARLGWRLTRDAITEMQTVSQSFGAKFVVMFVPFKSQVYLPLLEGAFPKEVLRSAFRFYLDAYGRDVDVDRLHANRLAQTRLMQRFCAEAGIAFLDTTPALMARVATGENVYFPDESHLNEAGEAILADTLAAYLRP